jgi:SSS family solute:Na+ symporter/sodium/proline symporter
MRVAVDALPAALGIMLICGAAAIIISTANSFLLTPASALMNDVYRKYVNPAADDRAVLVWTRVMVVVLGLLGFVALQFFRTILEMALWAYTMYGAAVTPALLAAFIWPRATRQGGIASIATGMVITLAWEIYAKSAGGYPGDFPTVYPAVIGSVAALIGVSLATPPPTSTELAAMR